MKLYYVPGVCSLAPHIGARELGLPLELKKVDRQTKLVDGEDYKQKNPNGYVPALELDDGQILTEAAVILQYLAEQRPEAGLAPRFGTMERWRLLEWLNFISSEVHKTFSPLFRDLGDQRGSFIERLTTRLGHVERSLAAGGAYLMGERFTIADAYLYAVLRWCQRIDLDLARFPAILAYFRRVQARPRVQEALRAEGLPDLFQ
jgi:glutathione S-transferase